MRIAILGAGYVGLVTAACLASLGNEVVCIDRETARIEGLRKGILPIREPGLEELVVEGSASGRLTFATENAAAAGCRLVIVAVGTLDADGEWFGGLVTRAVGELVRDPRVPRAIVIRSTLLPGTAAEIDRMARAIDPTVAIAFNPEFTREAHAVADFLAPDRVVLGVADPAAPGPILEDLHRLYAPLEAPVVVTDLVSAEMIKIAANVYLAGKVTFANELARLCAATGADVQAVVDGIGLDARIGRSFLSPGPGYGGSCFPSQVRALPALADRLAVRTPLMAAIDPSNDHQAEWLIDLLGAAVGDLRGRTIALLGLTFKAGTDDLRESPALRVGGILARRGARIAAWDPVATERGSALLAGTGAAVRSAGSVGDACTGADAAVVATEWPELRQVDWSEVARVMPGRTIVDGRHVVDRAVAGAAGFRVISLGVGSRA